MYECGKREREAGSGHMVHPETQVPSLLFDLC